MSQFLKPLEKIDFTLDFNMGPVVVITCTSLTKTVHTYRIVYFENTIWSQLKVLFVHLIECSIYYKPFYIAWPFFCHYAVIFGLIDQKCVTKFRPFAYFNSTQQIGLLPYPKYILLHCKIPKHDGSGLRFRSHGWSFFFCCSRNKSVKNMWRQMITCNSVHILLYKSPQFLYVHIHLSLSKVKSLSTCYV